MTKILLINGTPGVGKSTVARLVAQRLGVSQLIGTDTIREIMRKMDTRNEFTHIHSSAILLSECKTIDEVDVISGFVEQAKQVMIGVKSVISRCKKEGISCVLEGIHLLPSLIQDLEEVDIKAIVLNVSGEQAHFNRLIKQGNLRAEYKTRRFESIKKIQAFIVQEANRYGVKVIDNIILEDTVDNILSLYGSCLIDKTTV